MVSISMFLIAAALATLLAAASFALLQSRRTVKRIPRRR
jgi:hypothetical protein